MAGWFSALRQHDQVQKVLQWLARLGYWARGMVYLALGWLATLAAWSNTQPPTLKRALVAIAEHPFGWLILAAIAGGLFGYATWCVVQAIVKGQGEGSRIKGLASRVGTLMSAVVHAGLGLIAAAIVIDWERLVGGAGGSVVEAWAARVLDWPLGRWLVGIIGVGAILMGVAEFAKAHQTAFQDIRANGWTMTIIHVIGKLGLVAKGLIFGLIGTFFLMAAWQAQAAEAGGVQAAFRSLATAPLGEWLFLAVAAGLADYGLFSLLKGWYHHLPRR